MILRTLISHLPKSVVSGNLDFSVKGVTADSRKASSDKIFVAIRGTQNDGHKFINAAIENGARVIVAELAPTTSGVSGITWLHCNDSRQALGIIASTLKDNPSSKLKTVGVTGTNGKTTTTFLLQHIMKENWTRAGLIGTIRTDDGIEFIDSNHTTPCADVVHEELNKMLHNGCRGVAMEVSSHGIEQKRIAGISFDTLIFTNLSQDHLDYHGSMEAYFEVKKSIFKNLFNQGGNKKPAAVINADDIYGAKLAKEMFQNDGVKIITFGMGAHCDFKISKIQQNVKGTSYQLDFREKSFLVRMPFIGRFNIYNAIAAIAGAFTVGIKPRESIKALESAPQVPGRLELIGTREGATVFVDYAHTPDALKNVCHALKDLEPKRLITVFGCGGDRDITKRPLMGESASKISDFCIITSDNPRSEMPDNILKQIETGIIGKAYQSIADRNEAIRTAVNISRHGDIILIAGKGHETYQEINGEKKPFDDRQVARWALKDKPASNVNDKKNTGKSKISKQRKSNPEFSSEINSEKSDKKEYGEKPKYQKPAKYGERRIIRNSDKLKKPYRKKSQ